MNMKCWYVYIARSRTGRYYVGITTDVSRRIAEHNSGKGSKFAIYQVPLSLIYQSEPFTDKSLARRREIQIKNWSQTKKQKPPA